MHHLGLMAPVFDEPTLGLSPLLLSRTAELAHAVMRPTRRPILTHLISRTDISVGSHRLDGRLVVGNLRHNGRTGFQSAMHGTPARNFDQLAGHHSIDTTLDADHAFEAINLAGAAIGSFTAILAVLGRQLAVPYADGKAAKRELLVLGIDAERHRGARAPKLPPHNRRGSVRYRGRPPMRARRPGGDGGQQRFHSGIFLPPFPPLRRRHANPRRRSLRAAGRIVTPRLQ